MEKFTIEVERLPQAGLIILLQKMPLLKELTLTKVHQVTELLHHFISSRTRSISIDSPPFLQNLQTLTCEILARTFVWEPLVPFLTLRDDEERRRSLRVVELKPRAGSESLNVDEKVLKDMVSAADSSDVEHVILNTNGEDIIPQMRRSSTSIA